MEIIKKKALTWAINVRAILGAGHNGSLELEELLRHKQKLSDEQSSACLSVLPYRDNLTNSRQQQDIESIHEDDHIIIANSRE